MRITSKTQYGLRILLHVARESQYGRLASGRDIAAQQEINEPYLEQIMVSLKKAGLVSTVRGRNGGYQLAADAGQVTLLSIIEAFEGDLDLAASGDGAPKTGESVEARAGDCIWSDLTMRLREHAGGITLSQIRDEYTQVNPDYVI